MPGACPDVARVVEFLQGLGVGVEFIALIDRFWQRGAGGADIAQGNVVPGCDDEALTLGPYDAVPRCHAPDAAEDLLAQVHRRGSTPDIQC